MANNKQQITCKFGFTDPRDIEWATRTSKTSKSGLPYGNRPSAERYKSPGDDACGILLLIIIVMLFTVLVFS